MPIAIDYSGWRPSPATLKAAGVTIVIRYLKPLPNRYAIDAAELAALHAAGIAVVFVWEVTETSWTFGAPKGTVHGTEARRQLRALGVPDYIPVLAAYDTSVEPNELPVAREYQRAFQAACGATGAYATAFVIADFFKLGLATFAMQTNARGWFGNREDSPFAGLIQHYGASVKGLPPGPGTYDVNTVAKFDVGQYPRPIESSPHAKQESRMLSVLGVTPIDENHYPIIDIDPTDPTRLIAYYADNVFVAGDPKVTTGFGVSVYQLAGRAVKVAPRPDGVAVRFDNDQVHVATLRTGVSVS